MLSSVIDRGTVVESGRHYLLIELLVADVGLNLFVLNYYFAGPAPGVLYGPMFCLCLTDNNVQTNGPHDVDLSSHLDVFYTVYNRVQDTPQVLIVVSMTIHKYVKCFRNF